MSIKYSICTVHLNMAATVEKSLRSILTQIDERFEVVIVDQGSSDGSEEFLKEISKKKDNVRLFITSPNRNLGLDRRKSILEAKGGYVLPQLDMDDFFYNGAINDFIRLYHSLENKVNHDFFLSAPSINMATRSLLVENNYRNLPIELEDKELWNRLIEKNKFIGLDCLRPSKEIRGDRKVLPKLKRILRREVSLFFLGIPSPVLEYRLDKNVFTIPELEKKFSLSINDITENDFFTK